MSIYSVTCGWMRWGHLFIFMDGSDFFSGYVRCRNSLQLCFSSSFFVNDQSIDTYASIDDDDDLSDHLVNFSTTAFQRMRVPDSINPTLAKSYFIVNINGTRKYLHTQTAAWLFSNDKPTLCSDRLKRVMTNE